MSSDKYLDPPETKEILEEMKKLPTIGEINTLIAKTFPTWHITALKGFSTNYPHLNKNWSTLCEHIGVSPTEVLIVEEVFFDDEHTLIRNFTECLTRAGFCVRRKDDYIPCTKCELVAVPTPRIHDTFKEKSIPVPEKSIPICKDCQ